MAKAETATPTLDELTKEQKERDDKAYLDAVDEAIAEGLADAEAGRMIPAEKVWKDLGVIERRSSSQPKRTRISLKSAST